MGLATKLNNTASAQAAGYILQLERALRHLAFADANASVAVEHTDDVVVIRDDKITVQEQDKSTSKDGNQLLGDRSHALWRTLQVWLAQRVCGDSQTCECFLLFVNRPVSTPIAKLLKARMTGEVAASDIVAALRKAGKGKRSTKIQGLIDNVLRYQDSDLEALIELIEIVEEQKEEIDRAEISNRLGISPRANANDILDGLLGWITRRLRADWNEGRPGIITRREVLAQSFALQNQQARSRLLPRASSEVVILPADRERAFARPFVEHLGRIEADDEDILQAVDHFLKFNAEKYRLVCEGDIPDSEWLHRGVRLQERWRGIMRRHRRALKGSSASDIGHAVLADATYDYREALDGYPCAELYMTSGHYHRLADDDEIWWDPTYAKQP